MGERHYALNGKVTVITGGSRGLGLGLARAFLNEGAQVAICARYQEGLDEAVDLLRGGNHLLAAPAHIALEEEVRVFFEQVEARFGPVDILINNVGINLLTPSTAAAGSKTWKKVLDTNLNGTFFCSQLAARQMQQRGGSIVNISALEGSRVRAGRGIFSIAKAGVEMLTRVLAVELAPQGIRVNAVAPGTCKTAFSAPLLQTPEQEMAINATIPLGRIAEVEDIVEPVLFLASAGAAYITGQILTVDGGASLW